MGIAGFFTNCGELPQHIFPTDLQPATSNRVIDSTVETSPRGGGQGNGRDVVRVGSGREKDGQKMAEARQRTRRTSQADTVLKTPAIPYESAEIKTRTMRLLKTDAVRRLKRETSGNCGRFTFFQCRPEKNHNLP